MPLSVGDRLGHYEVLSLLGQGGMGEVYRARDTTLKRDVALKVLPAAFLRDHERMTRFQREAEVLASLDHPNIGPIHGMVESEDSRALVLALIEGPTLADRIGAGPLPQDEAVAIAKQIIEALEYAHDRGVVHRDLKPANVKITSEGVVKVLDFGLAKVLEDEPPKSSLSNSPTLTLGHTRAGVILGTAAYMSPEQAVGRPVDRRSDIFSFGAVLYEMLTGKRAFAGATTPDVLEAVVKSDPDWSKLPSGTPRMINQLLSRCLTKDRKQRLQAIGEARIILNGPLAATEFVQRKAYWIPWAVSAVLFLALAGALAWFLKPSPPLPITRFPFILGEGQAFTSNPGLDLAISPDGTQMVYVANNRLYLRSMAELEARPISGTNLGGIVGNPVFSPDGRSLAFWASSDVTFRDLTLKRVALSGGAAVTICPASAGVAGIAWSEEGIVFAQIGKGILRVSPNGGQPEALVIAEKNEYLIEPQMLSGGQAVLYTLDRGSPLSAAWDQVQIVVQTLKSGVRKVVLEGGSDARYLPTGHLVYALNGVLFALPFDLRRLEKTGGPVAIVEGIARVGTGGVAQFASSGTGSLIYIPGPVTGAVAGQNVLGLVDRKGEVEPLNVPPNTYGFPRVSRDGKRVAYQIDDGKDSSIWIYELSGAAAPRRLTLAGTGANRYPIWSSDNERVVFQSDRAGDPGIWWQRADGNGTAEPLTKPDKGASHTPDSWSPDGQVFSFTEEKNGLSAVWTYSLRDKKATVFAETPGSSLGSSAFSTDGHWVAYQSTTPPHGHIYVRPFPSTANPPYLAPEDGDSHHPLWYGKELFYIAGLNLFGSVSVRTQPSVSFGRPVRAPRSGFITHNSRTVRPYDILPDGKHFIGVVPARQTQSGQASSQIQVVLNWFEDVKQRAPGH
jgi:serine/threonine-protein kinase